MEDNLCGESIIEKLENLCDSLEVKVLHIQETGLKLRESVARYREKVDEIKEAIVRNDAKIAKIMH